MDGIEIFINLTGNNHVTKKNSQEIACKIAFSYDRICADGTSARNADEVFGLNTSSNVSASNVNQGKKTNITSEESEKSELTENDKKLELPKKGLLVGFTVTDIKKSAEGYFIIDGNKYFGKIPGKQGKKLKIYSNIKARIVSVNEQENEYILQK